MLLDRETQTLTEITNFIAQEAYKFAVLKLHSPSFSRIKNLYNDIFNKIQRHLNIDEFISHPLLVSEITNLIVLKAEKDQYEYEVKSIIESEYSELDNDIKNGLIDLANILYDEHISYHCKISHIYPPYILALEHNYECVLEYVYGLFYIPIEKKNSEETTITTSQAPFITERPLKLSSKLEFKRDMKEVPVSINALSRNKEKFKKSITYAKGNEKAIYSWIELDILGSHESVEFYNKISIDIDINLSMTDLELKQSMIMIMEAIYSSQEQNRKAKMLVAKNIDELNKAYTFNSLEPPKLSEIENLFKANIDGLNNLNVAKNWLLGMILIKEHWYSNKLENKQYKTEWCKPSDKVTLVERREAVSQKLELTYEKGGFSSGMVKRGEDLFRKLIKTYEIQQE